MTEAKNYIIEAISMGKIKLRWCPLFGYMCGHKWHVFFCFGHKCFNEDATFSSLSIRPSTKTLHKFYGNFGSISVSGQLRTYPSPNPTVTLTYYLIITYWVREGVGAQFGGLPSHPLIKLKQHYMLQNNSFVPKLHFYQNLIKSHHCK